MLKSIVVLEVLSDQPELVGMSLMCWQTSYLSHFQVSNPLSGRPVGSAVVDDWSCLRSMVDQWQATCRGGHPMDQYSMRHTRFFANLCNSGLSPEDLRDALEGSGCSDKMPTVL